MKVKFPVAEKVANRSSGSNVNPVQSVKVLANPVAATVANNPEGNDCNDVHPSNVLVKVKFPVAEKVANRSSGSVRSEEQPSKRLLPFLMLVVWPNSPLGIEAIDAHSAKIDATLETSGQEASRSEGMDVSFVHPLKACEKSVHLVIVEKSPRGIEPIGQSWKTAEQLVTPTCRAKRPAGIVSIPAPLNAPLKVVTSVLLKKISSGIDLSAVHMRNTCEKLVTAGHPPNRSAGTISSALQPSNSEVMTVTFGQFWNSVAGTDRMAVWPNTERNVCALVFVSNNPAGISVSSPSASLFTCEPT